MFNKTNAILLFGISLLLASGCQTATEVRNINPESAMARFTLMFDS